MNGILIIFHLSKIASSLLCDDFSPYSRHCLRKAANQIRLAVNWKVLMPLLIYFARASADKVICSETLLKSIKSTMDVVFQNLSDHLFDLILGIVCDYATTTSRANAVRAFGSLISSLTKANAKKVIAKLLPRCAEQIRIELEHGASSIRTTSTGLAIPSDTSLHWRMSPDLIPEHPVYCITQMTPACRHGHFTRYRV